MTDDVSRQAAALLIAEDEAEATQVVSEQPALEAPETEETPSWMADTSGLEGILDDDEVEETAPPTFEDDTEDEEPDWDADPAAAKKVAKLEKQLAWEREQRVKVTVRETRKEIQRRFPLVDPEGIQGDSRRSLIKHAAAEQTRLERVLKPHLQALTAAYNETKAEATQEGRAEAEASWGKPMQGSPTGVETEAAENAEKYKPSAYKRLEDLTLAKLKGGVLDIG